MTARRLVLWRHGQTDWNLGGRWQGQADIDLNETGRAQARAGAAMLAELGPDRLISSDLRRARDTAGALAELTGLQVETDERFREISMGRWEGLTIAEIGPDAQDLVARENEGEDVVRGEDGESVRGVAARVAGGLHQVAESVGEGDTAVVVMHGLAARVGAFEFLGMPPQALRWIGNLDNCHWLVMENRPQAKDLPSASTGVWRLTGFNLPGRELAEL